MSNSFGDVKSEIRVLGFDDGSFEPSDESTSLSGVIMRGGEEVEGFLVDEVEVDGNAVTSTMVQMIEDSRHKDQLRVVLMSGITFGGFNVLDIDKFFDEIGIPVIIVSRDKPDMEAVKDALKNLSDWEEKWEKLRKAGGVVPVEGVGPEGGGSTVYVQFRGIDLEKVEEIVNLTSTNSSIPEPLRIAHMVGTAISQGESTGSS